MPSSTQVARLAELLPVFATMEYNAALGFILCGLSLLSIGFGNQRLALLSGTAATLCLFVVYFGFVDPAPQANTRIEPLLYGTTLVIGFLMAFLLVLAAQFVYTAHMQKGAVETANRRIESQISKRRRAEDELRQSTASLMRTTKDLEDFAYVTSHDLTEPLRMVASFVMLLEKRYKGNLDPDADEFIGHAVDGVKRMNDLINSILTYSRVTTRGQPPAVTDSQIPLKEAIAALALAIENKQATVNYDAMPSVTVDGKQLQQVFYHLIDNAIKFCDKEAPRIYISAQRLESPRGSSSESQFPSFEPGVSSREFQVASCKPRVRDRRQPETRPPKPETQDPVTDARSLTTEIPNSKSAISNPPSKIGDPKLETQNSKPDSADAKPETRNLKPETGNPRSEIQNPQSTEWLFSVRDNGIGIAPEFAERIFGIFQRLHAPGEYPGTGIGLAICKRIIERHGGRIRVESVLHRGTTVFFSIPDRSGGGTN